jgi:hypothetical protein
MMRAYNQRSCSSTSWREQMRPHRGVACWCYIVSDVLGKVGEGAAAGDRQVGGHRHAVPTLSIPLFLHLNTRFPTVSRRHRSWQLSKSSSCWRSTSGLQVSSPSLSVEYSIPLQVLQFHSTSMPCHAQSSPAISQAASFLHFCQLTGSRE